MTMVDVTCMAVLDSPVQYSNTVRIRHKCIKRTLGCILHECKCGTTWTGANVQIVECKGEHR